MPEKANHSGFDKCNSCASTSDGAGLGPLSTVSHPQVCCLFKVTRPGQSAHDDNDLCEDCPSRKFQVGPVYRPPPSTTSDAPQQGSPSRKRKTIEPRRRFGFKKLTLEVRPPKFKAKLWFGTYSEDEIDRARDAVNYYLGRNEPYILPDSPRIFAGRPLKGMKFEDLLPTCDQVINGEPAYLVFARKVKEVIHSVLGKQKKSAHRKKASPLVRPGSTTSSDTECVSCPQVVDPYPMVVQPPEATFTLDDEELTELLRCTTQIPPDQLHQGPFSLYEMFSFPSAVPAESSAMEETGYSTALWCFPNEDPSLDRPGRKN